MKISYSVVLFSTALCLSFRVTEGSILSGLRNFLFSNGSGNEGEETQAADSDLAHADADAADAGEDNENSRRFIFDFLFPNRTITEEEVAALEVDEIDKVGLFLDAKEYQLGNLGFSCLMTSAGLVNSTLAEMATVFSRPIARVMLNSFGEDGIEKLCTWVNAVKTETSATRNSGPYDALLGGNQRRERNLRSLAEEDKVPPFMESVERRTQTCQAATPAYPATSGTYASWLSTNIQDYIGSNRADRSYAPTVITLILNAAIALDYASVPLLNCRNTGAGIMKIFQLIQIPIFNPFQFVEAIIETVCTIPQRALELSIMSIKRVFDQVQFHDGIIDGVEVHAALTNTETLIGIQCVRRRLAETMTERMDKLEQMIDELLEDV